MRGNELSEAQRERIIGAHLSGIKQTVISKKLGIPTSTVYDTIKRYKDTGSATPAKRPGRPKSLTQHDKRTLTRIIRGNRFSPLGDITSKLNSSLNTTLHNNTVRSYIHDEGLGSYVTRKKPF